MGQGVGAKGSAERPAELPAVLSRWAASGAAVRGDEEYKDGQPCQDAVCVLPSPEITCGALADGAGSARLSHLGAQCVVKETCAFLKLHFARFLGADREQARRSLVSHIQGSLVLLAAESGCEPRDLASTLHFVAVRGGAFVAGSLGDGILGMRVNGRAIPLFLPQKGEFANETVFVTSSRAGALLQVRCGYAPPIDAFIMMSDGAAESLYQRSDRSLARAVDVLWRWHESHAPDVVTDALGSNLKNVLRRKTKDDCSVVILTRVIRSADALRMDNDAFRRFFLLAPQVEEATLIEATLHWMMGHGARPDGVRSKKLRQYRRHLELLFAPRTLVIDKPMGASEQTDVAAPLPIDDTSGEQPYTRMETIRNALEVDRSTIGTPSAIDATTAASQMLAESTESALDPAVDNATSRATSNREVASFARVFVEASGVGSPRPAADTMPAPPTVSESPLSPSISGLHMRERLTGVLSAIGNLFAGWGQDPAPPSAASPPGQPREVIAEPTSALGEPLRPSRSARRSTDRESDSKEGAKPIDTPRKLRGGRGKVRRSKSKGRR